MENIKFTRAQLYDFVWSKTTTALAKEYGITDNSLRTTCKKYNIPLPYAGYWTKVKHNKPARKMKLPPNFEGKDEILINPPTEKHGVWQIEISALDALIIEIETINRQLLEVPMRLTNPNELINNAKDALTVRKDYFSNNGLIETKKGIVRINVAPENVSRALRFMDSLIKLLKTRGHEIKCGSDGYYAEVLEVPLFFRLDEKLRYEDVIERNHSWKTRKFYPTGIFMLQCWKDVYWHQKIWKDGKVRIEKQLAKIVAGIELMANMAIQERLKEEEYSRIREEKLRHSKELQRLEQERFDREELDGANFKKLLAQSQLWKQAMILHEYIMAVEDKAILSEGLTDELQQWLRWAKEKAEKFNPIGQ